MMRQSVWTRVRPVRLSLARRTLHSAPPPPLPPAPSPSSPSDDLLDASAFQPDQSIDQFSAFAHVLIDHPFPVGPYPYLTTIVLSTLALRLAFTLPATIWAHRRETRMKEVALPELMVFKNECKEGLVDGCRREGYSHEAYSKLLTERCKEAHKAILDKHSVAPLPTILLPLAVQFPLFITLVYVLRSASASTLSPLSGEILPWLETSIVEPDSTGMLPIGVGLLMWVNTDLMRGARLQKDELFPYETKASSDEEDGMVKTVEVVDKKGAKRMVEVETKKGWRERVQGNLFKGFAVGFAAISMFAPACMQVYFLTTYSFTLAQTVWFHQLDVRRLLALRNHLALHPPQAYGVRSADLPETCTGVPPLPKGAEKVKFKAPAGGTLERGREALKIEPVGLKKGVLEMVKQVREEGKKVKKVKQ